MEYRYSNSTPCGKMDESKAMTKVANKSHPRLMSDTS